MLSKRLVTKFLLLSTILFPADHFETSTNDVYFVHFHYVSVHLPESKIPPVKVSSVSKCAEECFNKGCSAFVYGQDQRCILYLVIEYNGSIVPSIYIRNVKQIPVPDHCPTESFAEKVIKDLGLEPCPAVGTPAPVTYCRSNAKCYFMYEGYTFWDMVKTCESVIKKNPHMPFTAIYLPTQESAENLLECHYQDYLATWMSRETATSPWQWGNGAPVNYTNWATGEPKGADNNCMMLNGAAKWMVYNCHGPRLLYAGCESDAYPGLR
ncbi:unnamed protein product [Anisakis simplex]|uniref:C-type lectin domain-containing protein n=1 Tax=Anisakis simplex TaxID=6269 RepID=A0A0M3JY19_ANISI|nr:unnamed protein product [Anisakis simplex]